jgi:hypothetical protein
MALAASSGGPSAYAASAIGFGDDDPFADDAPGASLELDLPANPRSSSLEPAPPTVSAAPASGAHAAAPSVRTPSAPAFEAPVEAAPVSSRGPDPAALIARFPVAPTKVWEMPVYAVKVLLRQLELRQDLTSLRRRRSPDVPLYERALRTHDAKTFTIGLALAGAAFAVACFLFFLPVLFRFLRAD